MNNLGRGPIGRLPERVYIVPRIRRVTEDTIIRYFQKKSAGCRSHTEPKEVVQVRESTDACALSHWVLQSEKEELQICQVLPLLLFPTPFVGANSYNSTTSHTAALLLLLQMQF